MINAGTANIGSSPVTQENFGSMFPNGFVEAFPFIITSDQTV
jgi:hypothetical protein